MQNIDEVFSKLDARIIYLKKLPEKIDHIFSSVEDLDIYQIESNIIRFKGDAIYRIDFTINELKNLDNMGISIINKFYYDDDHFDYEMIGEYHVPIPKVKEWDEKTIHFYYKKVKNEIHYYLEKLSALRESLEKENLGITNKSVSITIGSDFDFQALKLDNPSIEPILSKAQLALLFHYLKEARIILPYEKTSLSNLVMTLTGYSKNSIRTDLTYIEDLKKPTKKQKNLYILKTALVNVIETIDKDLNLKKRSS